LTPRIRAGPPTQNRVNAPHRPPRGAVGRQDAPTPARPGRPDRARRQGVPATRPSAPTRRLVPIDFDQAIVADAEMVRDLVQDDSPDLTAQATGIGTVETLEWAPVDRDLVGCHPGVGGTALGQRQTLVEPEQRHAGRRLLLERDRHVRHEPAEVRRQLLESVLDALLEVDLFGPKVHCERRYRARGRPPAAVPERVEAWLRVECQAGTSGLSDR
jgi:hypothetical protein